MSEAMDPDLLRAVRGGDPDLLWEILDKDVEVVPGIMAKNTGVLSGVTDSGENALHIAVHEGHLALAKELCSLHLSLVLCQNEDGDTPLHSAAKTGSWDMILLLTTSWDNSFDPDFNGMDGMDRYLLKMTNKYRNTALHEAVINDHDEAAVALLNLEPELASLVNYSLESPLYLAAQRKLLKITRALLRCPFTSVDGPGGRSALVDVLLWDIGNDESELDGLIGSRLGYNRSPSPALMDGTLVAAARHGKTNVVKELAFADPSRLLETTARSNTALHIAASYGRLEFFNQLCIANRWLLPMKNSRGDTALHCASRAGRHEIVSLIIDHSRMFSGSGDHDILKLHMYAILRAKNLDGDTALHEAARNGEMQVARRLVAVFPELLSFINAAGVSPLYLAVERGSRDISRLFLQCCRPTVRFKTEMKWTTVLQTDDLDVLSMVVDKLPEIEMYTPAKSHAGSYGQTTLHVAVLQNAEITEMLVSLHPELVMTVDSNGSTPLHHVVVGDNINILYMLLKVRPLAAYMQDKYGFAPIHAAARMGNTAAVRELVHHCPDCVDLVDNKGRTFLHVAILKKRVDVVRYALNTPGIEHIINQRDLRGDTPLHAATMSESEDIIALLIDDRRVKKISKNNDGSTPLDMAEHKLRSITGLRSYKIYKQLRSAGSCLSINVTDNAVEYMRNERDELQSQRALVNNLALVAVLIATVSFAAAFTLPGGYNSNMGPQQGAALLARRLAFKVFLASDCVAMICSIIVACILTYTAIQSPEAQPQSLQLAINIFWAALVAMVVAFGTGAYVVIEMDSKPIGVFVVIMSCSVPVIVWQLTSWGPRDSMYQLLDLLLAIPSGIKLRMELTWYSLKLRGSKKTPLYDQDRQ